MKKALFLFTMCCNNYLASEETTILLIRHGETDWNAKGLIQGHTNIPLNEQGLYQASCLADVLQKEHSDISVIFSSDLDRAYATAQQTALKFGLEIEKRSTLREIHYGKAEGLSFDEKRALYGAEEVMLDKEYVSRQQRWDHSGIPEAESLNQLLYRIKQDLEWMASQYPGKKIAVFTHGRVIKTLISDSLDADYPDGISNCAIAQFAYSSEDSKQLKFISLD